MPEQTKEFGYPPKQYQFTGDYHEGYAGYRRAKRNQDRYRAPIYKNDEGHVVLDMQQVEWLKAES